MIDQRLTKRTVDDAQLLSARLKDARRLAETLASSRGILAHESTTYRRMASDLFGMARDAELCRSGIQERRKSP